MKASPACTISSASLIEAGVAVVLTWSPPSGLLAVRQSAAIDFLCDSDNSEVTI
jgi:hypothetical protein